MTTSRSLFPLDGSWQFQAPDGDSWLDAVVPGCVHRDLRRHELIPDPFYARNELSLGWVEDREWVYRTTFAPPAAMMENECVDLVFGGLDTVACVLLNGEIILESENMFHAHRVAVKERLLDGENTLEVRFGSALDYIRTRRQEFQPPRLLQDATGLGSVRIRKQPCQFGWDWGPRLVTVGVWRPAFLEGWSTNRIESVHLTQTHMGGDVTLAAKPGLQRAHPDAKFRLTVHFEGEEVVASEGAELGVAIPDPKLWWPAGQGDQSLYTVRVELIGGGGGVVDSWERRIGLRTITLDREADEFEVKGEEGHSLTRFGLRVNGRLVFAKGANWIPAHSFVAGLERADYEPLLRSAIDAHMNLIRVWGGGIYEHDCFYEVCDELGLMVWQDFMFACNLHPSDDAFLTSVAREAEENVVRLRDHASLALWCGTTRFPG